MSISSNINLTSTSFQPNGRNTTAQTEYVAEHDNSENSDKTTHQQKKLNNEDLTKITNEMSKFMQLINSDIQFQLHEETKQLFVQVVDVRNKKVLKEFPSHEWLDTIANIREYVGLLLDKKA